MSEIRSRSTRLKGLPLLILISTGCFSLHPTRNRADNDQATFVGPPMPNESTRVGDSKAQQNLGKQVKRLALIEDFINARIFHKVEAPGRHPALWVDTRFRLLSFDEKQEFVGAVYAYYNNTDVLNGGTDERIVRILDKYSGKEVGIFGEAWFGLEMY